MGEVVGAALLGALEQLPLREAPNQALVDAMQQLRREVDLAAPPVPVVMELEPEPFGGPNQGGLKGEPAAPNPAPQGPPGGGEQVEGVAPTNAAPTQVDPETQGAAAGPANAAPPAPMSPGMARTFLEFLRQGADPEDVEMGAVTQDRLKRKVAELEELYGSRRQEETRVAEAGPSGGGSKMQRRA